MASFKDNYGKPVAKCRVTLYFSAARGDGDCDGDYWNAKTCKRPVRSPPPTKQHPVLMHYLSPENHSLTYQSVIT